MAAAAPRDIALLVLLGTLWGVSFTAISAGLRDVDAIFFAAVRYDIAALLMLLVATVAATAHVYTLSRERQAGILLPTAVAAALRSLRPRGARQWTAVLVSAALNVAGYHAFLYGGQQFTTAGVAAVIIGLNPIMAMVVARALLPGERVGPWGLVGLVLGLLGLVTLIGLKPGELLDARGVGEIIVFGAVLSWAFGAVLVKRLAHGIKVIPFTALQMFFGAILLHAVSLIVEGAHPRADWHAGSVFSLLYLAVIGSGLGFLLYFTLLERIGPIRSSLVSYIAPAVAALSGLIVLGQALELRMVLAFLLILAGFRLVIRAAPAPRSAVDLAPGAGAVARTAVARTPAQRGAEDPPRGPAR